MIKISIIIPIYNVQNYLHQCLNSVVNQTLKEIEIIAINDGSTDKSLEILQEFANKDKRIIVIDQKNSGYGKAVNAGLQIAKGEYIGIVEPDDFIDLNMYEELFSKTIEKKYEIVRSGYFMYYGDNDYYFHISMKNFSEDLLDNKEQEINPFKAKFQDVLLHPASIWSAIYRNDFLQKYNIKCIETPGASYQDLPFYIEAVFCAENMFVIPKAYYYYRQTNPNSSVNNTKKEMLYIIFDLMDYIRNRLNQLNSKKYKKYIYIWDAIEVAAINWNLSRAKREDKISYMKDLSNLIKQRNLLNNINSLVYYQFILDINHNLKKNIIKCSISKKSYVKIKNFCIDLYKLIILPPKILITFLNYLKI